MLRFKSKTILVHDGLKKNIEDASLSLKFFAIQITSIVMRESIGLFATILHGYVRNTSSDPAVLPLAYHRGAMRQPAASG